MTSRALRFVLASSFAFGLALAAAATAEPNASSEPFPASLDPAASEAPVCKAGDGATTGALLGSKRAIENLRERLRAEIAAEGGDPPIVLNGRGYGYGITNGPRDPAEVMRILEREARAQQQ